MNKARSQYTIRLRMCMLLLIGCALAAGIWAAPPAASQSGLDLNTYLPLIVADVAQPTPTPTHPIVPSPTPGPSPTPWPSPTPGPSPTPVLPASVFGMVMSSISPERGFDSLRAAGVTWIRSNNTLLWRDVEPVEGDGYQWNTPAVQRIEQEMLRASEAGLRYIMIVRGSPRWATTPYQADCAPIHPTKYARFAAFVAAAVARYSQPPYNVVYWQLGNEPDAYIFQHDSGYGCWGVRTDPYYGGRAYGDMLKVVYPAIKAANPAVQVLHGSLLLDRPYNPQTGSGLSARFLEGVLLAGAADSFDILPYNAYFWGNDLSSPDWKTPYLRSVMSSYNIPPKPMLMTETGLLCDPGCPKLQGYAVGRYYTRALSFHLLGTMWYIYDSDAFHHTAMVEPQNPDQHRPAYQAYQHAIKQLLGATYSGALEGQPSGVEGYRFVRPGGALTVFWSSEVQQVSIPVAPGASVTCTAWDGAPLPCVNIAGAVELTADLGPIYLVEGSA
jgi:hypothetical protein